MDALRMVSQAPVKGALDTHYHLDHSIGPEVVRVATDCGRWLADSRIPKLFINAEPGAILTGRQREFCRIWRNQTELTVEGIHFIQEDSPEKIGEALAAFVRSLRSL